jgi:hypothetical protein
MHIPLFNCRTYLSGSQGLRGKRSWYAEIYPWKVSGSEDKDRVGEQERIRETTGGAKCGEDSVTSLPLPSPHLQPLCITQFPGTRDLVPVQLSSNVHARAHTHIWPLIAAVADLCFDFIYTHHIKWNICLKISKISTVLTFPNMKSIYLYAYQNDQLKKDENGVTCSIHGRDEKWIIYNTSLHIVLYRRAISFQVSYYLWCYYKLWTYKTELSYFPAQHIHIHNNFILLSVCIALSCGTEMHLLCFV